MKKSEPITRTDAEIARDVRHKMKADFEVPDNLITANVANGFVTIEGTVHRDSQKDAAESCARKVEGVRGVNNKINVDPTAAPLEA